jgi:inorganic phosphate transporter, PiT family
MPGGIKINTNYNDNDRELNSSLLDINRCALFDFINMVHDSANLIATVVGTRVLRPLYAVSMTAVANFIGPFIFGTAVAATVGNGIIQPEFSTVYIIVAALVGGISWNLITWYIGLLS